MKVRPKHIGVNLWCCEECLAHATGTSAFRNNPTPHCTDCGNHHPLHILCDGTVVKPCIEYLQLFYSFPSVDKSVGVA